MSLIKLFLHLKYRKLFAFIQILINIKNHANVSEIVRTEMFLKFPRSAEPDPKPTL